jgi:hypothetical protein
MTMSLPWTDWQFYVVTGAGVAGLWMLWRVIGPTRRKQAGSCPTCSSGSAASARKRKTSLTVEGRRP